MPNQLQDPRRIQETYEDSFNNGSKDLLDAEIGDTSAYAEAGIDQAEAYLRDAAGGDGGAEVRDNEQTKGAWENNTSAQAPSKSVGGLRGFAGKAKVFLKNKAATTAIVALLGGGAFVPFLGAASLPFSIIGNMDSKSALLGLNQYSQDYYGFRIFGGDQASVKNGPTGQKLAGLSKKEILQLEKNGVTFQGAKVNPVTKKTTFTAVRVGAGEWVPAGSAFNKELRTNVIFRKAMIFNKGSLWKSAKSLPSTSLRSLLRLTSNPDLSGKTTEEKNQKLLKESVEGSDGSIKTGAIERKDKDGKVENQDAVNEVDDVKSDLDSKIEDRKSLIASGEITTELAESSNMGNIGTQLSREGVDVAASAGVGGKIWNFVNVLGPLDTVCTIYQTAYTANMVARTVAMVNIMRFANTLRVAIERAKAGDDDGESVKYLMEMLQQKDPTTGQSFDGTSYAAMLFTGKLSAEPSAVSAFGGQSMVALSATMTAVHGFVGAGNPFQGRQTLRQSCNLVTNLGVQVLATAGAAVATVFTGGAAGAGIGVSKVALTAGMNAAKTKIIEKVAEKFGKAAIKKALQDEAGNITAKSVVKNASRNAWRGFSTTLKNMSGWDKVGLLVTGVSAFGMAYIVDVLSGGNVAGFLKNGFSAFDGVGSGTERLNYLSGMANGGNVGTYDTADQYEATRASYEQQYIADAKYDAKDTPFDLTTPYSTLGAAVFSTQKLIGVSASLDMMSTLRAVASLPLRIPSLGMAPVSAAEDALTPQAIGNKIGNTYMQENQIALTITGSPQLVFNKSMDFQKFVADFVDNAEPQVTYEGDDPESGDPLFQIISGSKLDEYAKTCHDPEKAEVDPEYAEYDYRGDCIDNAIPEYDDALRFINQVSADATQAEQSRQSGAVVSADGFAWPFSEADYKANKSTYLKPHIQTGTAWGSDSMGTRDKGAYTAIDIGKTAGTKVRAMFSGTVTSTSLCGANDGVAIKSDVGGKTLGVAYMHGDNQQFKVGDTVSAGDVIMDVAMRGCDVYGAHLHIGIAYDGNYICPQDVFVASAAGSALDFGAFVTKAKSRCGRI